ncbi:hypothetical protein CcaCcLH18_07560 [Colletotrichum camelliae]|nr:hypothetical protein CcaCcLH18_07560 [Colletotrichum camelliae]
MIGRNRFPQAKEYQVCTVNTAPTATWPRLQACFVCGARHSMEILFVQQIPRRSELGFIRSQPRVPPTTTGSRRNMHGQNRQVGAKDQRGAADYTAGGEDEFEMVLFSSEI